MKRFIENVSVTYNKIHICWCEKNMWAKKWFVLSNNDELIKSYEYINLLSNIRENTGFLEFLAYSTIKEYKSKKNLEHKIAKKKPTDISIEQIEWIHKLLLYYSAHEKQLRKEIQKHEKVLFG